ncbi:DUF2237 family protein [Limnohabitans sp. Rim8]
MCKGLARQWCFIALGWKQAYRAGIAQFVVFERTQIRALNYVTLEQLRS